MPFIVCEFITSNLNLLPLFAFNEMLTLKLFTIINRELCVFFLSAAALFGKQLKKKERETPNHNTGDRWMTMLALIHLPITTKLQFIENSLGMQMMMC